MAMTALQKNRSVRREAMREQLSVYGHHQQLLVALEDMTELANGDINQESKDRFAMLAVIADKHWRVVEKYLPPMQIDATQQSPPGSAQSALQRVIGQLVQPLHQSAHNPQSST